MSALDTAIQKIEDHARRQFERPFRDSAFALALTHEEVEALRKAYPRGFPVPTPQKGR